MTLILEGLGYRYAGASQPALRDVDLVLEPGRVVGVAGRNESGKSTLCLVASGLAPASIGGELSGTLRLDGVDAAGLRPYEFAQRCGILFQNPSTQLSGTSATVFEEIAFGPRNLGLDIADIVDRVQSTAELLRIDGLLDRDPARLSGGQAQLVALGSVLALRPAHLVLDEPTSQLDPEGTRLVGEAIRRIADAAGSAVLVVEHKTGLLTEIADDVIVLDAGRVRARGTIERVFDDPAIAELGIDPPPAVRLRRALEGAGARASAVRRVVEAVGASRRTAAR